MPADRLLGTLLRSLQIYTDQQDTPRVLGTTSSLLTTLNNPLNVTLLTSQLLSAPAIWAVPDGLQTCMRCMSVFHSAAQALIRHENASHDKSPDRDFSQLQLERTLPKDDWIRAVAKGADEHSALWRHLLALGGLLVGFGPAEDNALSRSMRSTLEQEFVNAVNLALEDVVEADHFGQQSITLVLNYCFPLVSDVERSQIDFDQLLPVLMRSTFRNMDGLGSTYFLGAIDVDITTTPEQQYRWPDQAPSFQSVQRTLASPLVSSLGSLARLIGHTLEQVRAPWLVSSAVEDLEDFTKTLHLQWRQNKLSTVDASEEQQRLDPGTLHTTDLLWRLLRSTMYAAVIVLRSAIGRVLADPGLADDDAASSIAVQTLNSLRNLYFVSTRSGSATFSQYTFVYLTAVDILSSYPQAAQAYLEHIRPSEAGSVPQLPLDRNLDLFFLNTSEHLTLVLEPAFAEELLVNSAAPYLASGGDANLLPIFEAAHSVMLAVFSAPQNADIANRHLPFYVEALFRVFPMNLSARQFRLAFKTLIQITSPPSPLSLSQPELPSILLELLYDRAKHATTEPLAPRPTDPSAALAAEGDVPLSEQAVIVLTVVDILTQLSLDLLDEWLPIAADMVNTIDDENMREHCKEHFWLNLVDGAMDPERSRVCHSWWSSAGGREHVLFGRDTADVAIHQMSGALPEAQSTSKLLPTSTLQRFDVLRLLGHPHHPTAPQDTEPFWQQAPEIAHPKALYYSREDLYTLSPIYYASLSAMDPTPVVIGFKSRYAHAGAPQLPRVRKTCRIYLEDQYVGEISLGSLVRFSKFAKETFPRPPLGEENGKEGVKEGGKRREKGDVKGQNKSNDKVETGAGATAYEKLSKTPVKDWADSEQSDVEKGATASPTEGGIATPPLSPPQVTASEQPVIKELVIAVPGAWIQPNLSVAKHILTWMEQNKRTRNDEPLLPLTPIPLTEISLKALIDTYTGVLAYDLTPFPKNLRHEIMTRLSLQPAHADLIQYIYEHIPIGDPIISRMTTSFFEHTEAGNYSQAEIDAIYEYVHEYADDGGELERHFDGVKRSRNYKRSRENAMDKLRQGFEDFAGPIREALPAVGGQGVHGAGYGAPTGLGGGHGMHGRQGRQPNAPGAMPAVARQGKQAAPHDAPPAAEGQHKQGHKQGDKQGHKQGVGNDNNGRRRDRRKQQQQGKAKPEQDAPKQDAAKPKDKASK